MGDWYRVVKTIKGHSYIYEQQTFRDGGRVRTRNRYIGAASGEKSATVTNTRSRQRGVTTTPSSPVSFVLGGIGGFGSAMLGQFDLGKWGAEAAEQIGSATRSPRKSRARKQRFSFQFVSYSYTMNVQYVSLRCSFSNTSQEQTHRKQTWFIKDYDEKRATGDVASDKKVFLGYIRGKKYYSIGRASRYWTQHPPKDEIWDYE